jgi:hypothetical protein
VNDGAPSSDQAKLLEDSTTLGPLVESGGSEGLGDVPTVEGIATVPAALGLTVGVGVGVAVETSIGEGTGGTLGLGVCPNVTSANRNAVTAHPPAKEFFEITKWGV